MGYLLPLVLICSTCLADAESSLSQMPPLPDFKTPVDYAAWVENFGEINRIHIVQNYSDKDIRSPKPSKPVKEFVRSILANPRSWDAAKHPEVAKWVNEVRTNMDRYLKDLPWKLYDPNYKYCFSSGYPTFPLLEVITPNDSDVESIVDACVLAALEKHEQEPLLRLKEAVSHMKDIVTDPHYFPLRDTRGCHYQISKATAWCLQNRGSSLGMTREWVSTLTGIQAGDYRLKLIQSMRIQCAEIMSLIQWLASIDDEGNLKYDKEKFEKFFSSAVCDGWGCCVLMQKEADPARDARQCREYYASICDVIYADIKNPGCIDVMKSEQDATEKSPYGHCVTILFRSTYWVLQDIQMLELERRLDCLGLHILLYKKQYGHWPKSLKDISGVAPEPHPFDDL